MTARNLPEPKRLSSSDEAYPQRLRVALRNGMLPPPDLWLMGNESLLGSQGVGFCGSRSASEASLAVAVDCAAQLSEQKLTVISGYAPGVDMASHEAALRNGGQTIVVLPEGIQQFRIKKALKEIWDWNRILVCSYFPPTAVWRVDRAMDRNKAIVGLSDAVIVLEARDKGGTLNAGFQALEMKKPLFVAHFSEQKEGREGNAELIDRGGIPLQRNRLTGRANLTKVIALIKDQSSDGRI